MMWDQVSELRIELEDVQDGTARLLWARERAKAENRGLQKLLQEQHEKVAKMRKKFEVENEKRFAKTRKDFWSQYQRWLEENRPNLVPGRKSDKSDKSEKDTRTAKERADARKQRRQRRGRGDASSDSSEDEERARRARYGT